ncbi:hypothetical protein [Candidatus Poriferisodalis sp.]|uniref:hypothetical protein n=1 Tax=Candidatus Poriferisodalis sp. TaxID=3101277 RepID=UPI003D145EA5
MGDVTGCLLAPTVHRDRIDFVSANGAAGNALYSIPWGDEAYPQFWFDSEYLTDRTLEFPEWLQIDLVSTNSGSDAERYWMRVSIADQTRWYGIYRGGLRAVDAADLVEDDTAIEQERMHGGPTPLFDGSDGQHYAFRVREPSDTSCPFEYGFVVDGVTGNVITCGEAFGGPVLVNQAVDRVDGSRFMLPRPVRWQVCEDGIDLRLMQEPRQ